MCGGPGASAHVWSQYRSSAACSADPGTGTPPFLLPFDLCPGVPGRAQSVGAAGEGAGRQLSQLGGCGSPCGAHGPRGRGDGW